MSALLSIGEAARRLGLSVDTLRELERSGELKAERTPGGHRRFKPAVLDAYVARPSAARGPLRRAEGGAEQVPRPSRSRNYRRADDELPDQPPELGYEEADELPPPRPAPRQKTASEQAVESFRETLKDYAESSRMNGLKSYARALIPWNATDSARSAVLEVVDSYVTATRFPPSASTWQAREAIEAKIGAVLEPFNAAAKLEAEHKAREGARRAEREQAEQRMAALRRRGESHALTKTVGWEYQDAQDARADVERALKDEVESDWTERDVDDLVDDVLEDWEEDDENDNEDED